MDEAQGFEALRQADSLPAVPDDAVLLKPQKVEIPDEQNEEEQIPAMLWEAQKQDLIPKTCFITIDSGKVITNLKTEPIENETSEETLDFRNKASDDAVLLKSLKLEIPDKQDEEEDMPATLKEEEMTTEQDLNVKSCSITDSEFTPFNKYITFEWIKTEPSEETPDLENKASDDPVLLKSAKVEKPDEQDEEEEIPAMFKEDMIIEQDLNVKSCFLTDSETPADTLYNENLVTKVKIERIERETSEETDLGNQASGADAGVLSTPTGASVEPDETFILCNDCGNEYDKNPQIIQHIKSQDTKIDVSFNCGECDHSTVTRDALEKHLRLHDKSRQHQCDECGWRFTRNGSLLRHIKIMHSVDKETNHYSQKSASKRDFRDKPLSCSTCGLEFSENSYLKVLMRREKPFSCTVCTYKCSEKHKLKLHMRVHTGEKPFSCHLCTYQCAHKNSLKMHMLAHTGEIPFSCSICGNKFSRNSHLKDHMRSHTGEKPFSCSICAYTSSYKSSLRTHMRSHTGEKPFSCSLCPYTGSQKYSLISHMRSHTGEKLFSCSICGYKCATKSSLSVHVRVHTGEKPFSCSVCAYTCSRKQNLKAHMRSHTSEKPFSCPICAYTCSRKIYLKAHMRSHTGEKPFSCSSCEYTCSQKNILNSHMRSHSVGKPFSCSICGYKSATKHKLSLHMRVHTGEKPFSCALCTYTCSRKQNLKAHLRSHTGEKPFSCAECAYTCSRKIYLKAHMRSHTGEKPFSSSNVDININSK